MSEKSYFSVPKSVLELRAGAIFHNFLIIACGDSTKIIKWETFSSKTESKKLVGRENALFLPRIFVFLLSTSGSLSKGFGEKAKFGSRKMAFSFGSNLTEKHV